MDITAASHSRLRLNKENFNFQSTTHDANIPTSTYRKKVCLQKMSVFGANWVFPLISFDGLENRWNFPAHIGLGHEPLAVDPTVKVDIFLRIM